jgi:hypothetical protein
MRLYVQVNIVWPTATYHNRWGARGHLSVGELSKISDQDYIACHGAARQGELFPVA